MRNAGFLDYRMLTCMDLPLIESKIVEVPHPGHPLGIRGVGEVSIVPPPAAVANAVCRAIGVRITDCPMSPPRIVDREEPVGTHFIRASSPHLFAGVWHDALLAPIQKSVQPLRLILRRTGTRPCRFLLPSESPTRLEMPRSAIAKGVQLFPAGNFSLSPTVYWR